MTKSIEQALVEYVSAGTPALALRTSEETRALATLARVAKQCDRPLTVWNAREGLLNLPGPRGTFTAGDFSERKDDIRFPAACASAILTWLTEHTVNENGEASLPKECWPGILVFCDLHPWLKEQTLEPQSERALRDLVACASFNGLTVIFLGCQFQPPASFARYVTVLDYKLPDQDALSEILANTERACKDQGIELTPPENGQRQALIRAATGLTCHEAEQAYSLAVARALDPDKPKAPRTLDPVTVSAEKALAIKRTGHLEIQDPDPRGLDAVGGLGALKKWLLERKQVYSPKARAYGLPTPKGILLAGLPGTGKSLTAKILGAVFQVPTLRLDLGRLFGSLVGESEARTDEVLAMIDAVAPCCLVLEEIEKGLQGTHGGANHDSGVGSRILGKLLYWMQERESDVFVAATCNEPWLLPAPFLRRGRFDALWWVDVPGPGERSEIARVHLARSKRDPGKFDLAKIASASHDFVGSEIEEAVKSALFRAYYDNGREIETRDVLASCAEIAKSKMVDVMAEQIEAMRKFGDRCQKASDEKEAPNPKAREVRRLLNS